jgi:hypothetical protein
MHDVCCSREGKNAMQRVRVLTSSVGLWERPFGVGVSRSSESVMFQQHGS